MEIGTASPRPVHVRQRLVWRVLRTALDSMTGAGQTVAVLDCGGGSGSFAVPLARFGASVTVVDVSVDALATLARRATEAGVAAAVHGVQGDVEALGEVVPSESFDLVLVHDVLESIDDVPAAIRAAAEAVRPGGWLSVLIANPVAMVLSQALTGDVAAALAELKAGTHERSAIPTSRMRLDAAGVAELCDDAGLVVEQIHGIGVFADLVPGAVLEAQPGAADSLDELEELASSRQPYRDIAGRLHLLARRPAVDS